MIDNDDFIDYGGLRFSNNAQSQNTHDMEGLNLCELGTSPRKLNHSYHKDFTAFKNALDAMYIDCNFKQKDLDKLNYLK